MSFQPGFVATAPAVPLGRLLMPLHITDLKRGTPVWVGIPGFPWWPARVASPAEVRTDEGFPRPKPRANELLVEFFNDKRRWATVDISQVRSFADPHWRSLKSRNGSPLHALSAAVNEAREYCKKNNLRDPYSGYSSASNAQKYKRPVDEARSVLPRVLPKKRRKSEWDLVEQARLTKNGANKEHYVFNPLEDQANERATASLQAGREEHDLDRATSPSNHEWAKAVNAKEPRHSTAGPKPGFLGNMRSKNKRPKPECKLVQLNAAVDNGAGTVPSQFDGADQRGRRSLDKKPCQLLEQNGQGSRSVPCRKRLALSERNQPDGDVVPSEQRAGNGTRVQKRSFSQLRSSPVVEVACLNTSAAGKHSSGNSKEAKIQESTQRGDAMGKAVRRDIHEADVHKRTREVLEHTRRTAHAKKRRVADGGIHRRGADSADVRASGTLVAKAEPERARARSVPATLPRVEIPARIKEQPAPVVIKVEEVVCEDVEVVDIAARTWNVSGPPQVDPNDSKTGRAETTGMQAAPGTDAQPSGGRQNAGDAPPRLETRRPPSQVVGDEQREREDGATAPRRTPTGDAPDVDGRECGGRQAGARSETRDAAAAPAGERGGGGAGEAYENLSKGEAVRMLALRDEEIRQWRRRAGVLRGRLVENTRQAFEALGDDDEGTAHLRARLAAPAPAPPPPAERGAWWRRVWPFSLAWRRSA